LTAKQLVIPWIAAVLRSGLARDGAWLANTDASIIASDGGFAGDKAAANWLPDEVSARGVHAVMHAVVRPDDGVSGTWTGEGANAGGRLPLFLELKVDGATVTSAVLNAGGMVGETRNGTFDPVNGTLSLEIDAKAPNNPALAMHFVLHGVVFANTATGRIDATTQTGVTLPSGRFFAEGMDVPEIHTWSTGLGGHALGDPAGQSVVLIRGELLRRYPGAIVMARAARWTGAGHREVDDAVEDVDAVFRAQLEPDVTFVGLPISIDALVGAPDPAGPPGFYLVIQEPPTEPRFGLDHDATARTSPPAAWRDLTWGHLSGGANPTSTRFARADALPAGTVIDGLAWGRDAAHQAAITLQDPVRLLVHARHLFREHGTEA
jgi:hypothetical protein